MKRSLRLLSLLLCLLLLPGLCSSALAKEAAASDPILNIVFLDVGQGDCTLLFTDNAAMLIDAGDSGSGASITAILDAFSIEKLDYLIATHPHEDHIGGMAEVLDAVSVSTILAPKVSHDTETYRGFLSAVKEAGAKITVPKSLKTYKLDKNISFTILGPTKSDDSLNNNSIVLKATYGEVSFLFAGDAESAEEKTLLASSKVKKLLPSTVLKVGHHGSSTSTSPAFAKAVSPSYAIVSVGADNAYNHPDALVLKRLQTLDAAVLRTDEDGAVFMATGGKTLAVRTLNDTFSETRDMGAQPKETPSAGSSGKNNSSSGSAHSSAAQPSAGSSGAYIGNRNTHKFHRASCSSLPSEKNRVYFSSRSDAVSSGYAACKRCKP